MNKIDQYKQFYKTFKSPSCDVINSIIIDVVSYFKMCDIIWDELNRDFQESACALW